MYCCGHPVASERVILTPYKTRLDFGKPSVGSAAFFAVGLSSSRLAHTLPQRTMVFPLTTPSPGINYNFVAGAYLACSLILVVLLALDKVGVEREQLCAAVGL